MGSGLRAVVALAALASPVAPRVGGSPIHGERYFDEEDRELKLISLDVTMCERSRLPVDGHDVRGVGTWWTSR